jgi:hypothetical protein
MCADLGAIKSQILDRLRGKPSGKRIIDVVVYPADCDCGWSARAIGDLNNDERREFIVVRAALQRDLIFSPE